MRLLSVVFVVAMGCSGGHVTDAPPDASDDSVSDTTIPSSDTGDSTTVLDTEPDTGIIDSTLPEETALADSVAETTIVDAADSGTTLDTSLDAGPPPPPLCGEVCAAGKKSCVLIVSIGSTGSYLPVTRCYPRGQPEFGCDGAGCTPCAPAHAVSTLR